MNDDYPHKITRQDKNLSEVEYVQVSNEVKPVAWIPVDPENSAVVIRDAERAKKYHEQCYDLMPVYASPLSPEEMRQIIEALQLGKLVIDASENSWDAFDLIGSAIKLLESRL